jgi:hypothetical protein
MIEGPSEVEKKYRWRHVYMAQAEHQLTGATSF